MAATSCVRVDRLGVERLAAGKGEQAVGQRRGAVGGASLPPLT